MYRSPGGDTVQVDATAANLRLLGVDVDIATTDTIPEYRKYDIVHFFNIIRPADILRHLGRFTQPFVVSTIFVDYSEFEQSQRNGLAGLTPRRKRDSVPKSNFLSVQFSFSSASPGGRSLRSGD